MWTEKNPTRLGGSFLYGPLASFLLSIVTVGKVGGLLWGHECSGQGFYGGIYGQCKLQATLCELEDAA